ncbi:MAG: T9SS type A sorting domain-containing protein [Saprospiraceae bacterium]|nr:T9SS type A sorting domain-containing protein [Saprospiraceae bacterium]
MFIFSCSYAFSQVQLKPSIGINSLPNDTDSVCPIVPRTQGNTWIPVNVGDTMADFKLYDLNGDSVILSSVLNSGKRALIVSGSYTCPIFRNHMTELNAVAAQYGNQIECFVVYSVEAHPTGSPMPYSGNINPTNPPYYQPATYGERKAIVSDLINGVGTGQYIPVTVNVPIYIDGPCNEWWEYYNGPNNAYLVDTNGVLFAYHSWFSNTNPPNGPSTNIWCDIDSLLGVNSGGCSQITGLGGTFDFELSGSPSAIGNPGDVIDIFGKIKNTSNDGVEVFIQRMMNNLPSPTWETSMCITVCLPSNQDTVSVTIAAGDSVDFSMHFFTDILMNTADTGRARIRFTNKNGGQQPQNQMFRGITELKTNNKKIENKNLKIYPNPTDGILYVDASESIEKIIIYAPNGQTIKEIFEPYKFIDIADLYPGIYFIKIHSNSKITSAMVIKEK